MKPDTCYVYGTEGQNSPHFAPFGKAWSAPSDNFLTFGEPMPGNKKATENIGYQIDRLASRLKSETNWFENCPARSTDVEMGRIELS